MSLRAWMLWVVAAGTLMAQGSNALTGRVGATILSPAQATGMSDLRVEGLRDAGTVTLRSDGTATQAGRTLPQADGTGQALGLKVRGGPRTSFSLCLPQTARLLGPGGQSMMVHGFRTTDPAGATNGKGERVVRVGATLDLPKGLSQGHYTGIAEILVAFE